MGNDEVTEKLDESNIEKFLGYIYEKAVNGFSGLDSAIELGDDYLKGDDELEDKINSLIRWQNTKSFGTGFATGVGGLATMPVAVPAGMASALFIQIRMIAAIAHMCGFNIKDDRVKTLCFVCLTGHSAKDFIKSVGIKITEKMAQNLIKNIPGKILIEINKRVGIRLLTKGGATGIINLTKAIPLIGGVVSGSVDAAFTNSIGNAARDTFK